MEGIVLETGARLIKWKVILTHRGKLFANIHHWKLKKAQRILDIPQHCRSMAWPVKKILLATRDCFRLHVKRVKVKPRPLHMENRSSRRCTAFV